MIIAKEQCANWISGNCVALGKDCIAKDKRCEYLEKCVIPLKLWTNHPNHAHISREIDKYLDLHKNGKNGK